jgi:hypothetical protein
VAVDAALLGERGSTVTVAVAGIVAGSILAVGHAVAPPELRIGGVIEPVFNRSCCKRGKLGGCNRASAATEQLLVGRRNDGVGVVEPGDMRRIADGVADRLPALGEDRLDKPQKERLVVDGVVGLAGREPNDRTLDCWLGIEGGVGTDSTISQLA